MSRRGHSKSFNLFADGDALRDAGMEQVLSSEGMWLQRCLERINKFPRGWEGIAEDWRLPMEADGLKPHHQNAWGALTNAAKRYNIIEDTGRMRKPLDATSHSRPTKIWRRL